MRSSELIIVILLIILVLFAFIYGISTSSRSKYLASPLRLRSEVLYNQEKSIIDEVIYSKRQARKTKYVSWGRSPFSLPAQSAE